MKMPVLLLLAAINFFVELNRERRKPKESGTFIERYGQTLASLAVFVLCMVIFILRYTGIMKTV